MREELEIANRKIWLCGRGNWCGGQKDIRVGEKASGKEQGDSGREEAGGTGRKESG